MTVVSGDTGVDKFGNTVIAGHIIQVANTVVSTVATGTTLLPFDDTIPQNTEGDQYMSLAFTPKFATSLLKIDVSVVIGHSAANNMIVALFRDTTAGAIGVSWQFLASAPSEVNISFSVVVPANSIANTTFKVRAGGNLAGTTTFNGRSGTRYFGGVSSSSITITEIAQ